LGIPDSVDIFEEDTAKSAFKGDPKWQYYDLGKVNIFTMTPINTGIKFKKKNKN